MDTVQSPKEKAPGIPQPQVKTPEQELAALKARADRNSLYLSNAEQQLIEAQSLISLVLSEAEDKLRWAASIDRALHTLQNVLAERDEDIKRQQARIAELEAKVAGFDARYQAKETEALESASKIARMQDTFSWKATAPLRFLRRTLIDKKSNG